MPTRSRTSRRLQFESLETRSVPAGNVTAVVAAGVLKIQGDAQSNGVFIRQIPAATSSVPWSGYRYEIVGYDIEYPGDKTGPREVPYNQINGQRSVIVEGVTKGVTIDLQVGNDVLKIRGSDGTSRTRSKLAGQVDIRMGAGDDRLSAWVENNFQINVNMGTGEDGMQLHGRVNHLTVNLESSASEISSLLPDHHEWVALQNVTARGDVALFGSGGDDSIGVRGSKTQIDGALTIRSFAGNDFTYVGGESGRFNDSPPARFLNRVAINTSDGNDYVVLGSLSASEDFVIDTGRGKDEVRTSLIDAYAVFESSLSVILGSGADRLNEFNRVASKRTTLSGGDGTDTVRNYWPVLGATFGEKDVSGFEKVEGGSPL